MTMELRKLFFTEDELREVIAGFGRHAGVPMPKGPPDLVTVQDDPAGMITARFFDPGPGFQHDYRIPRDQVQSMLILFCHDRGVPLPRYGQKDVKVEKGKLTLVVSIHWRRR